MRSAYLDYAMSVIVGPRAARRPRRPQARPSPRPLRDERERARPDAPVRQVRPHRRRGDGQLPPARRLGDLRHARPHGAGLLHARAARRRPGQLRLDRRRPGRGHAVHRGAHDADRAGDAARPRHGHRRLRAELRRLEARAARPPVAVPEPARQRLVRHRGRHGDEHPAAQPARGHRRGHRLHRQPARSPSRSSCGTTSRAPTSRPAASSSAAAASATPTTHGPRPRARAGEGAHRGGRRAARRRSSSPSCPSW